TYLFAVCMRGAAATASFTVTAAGPKAAAEVLGEGRRIDLTGGAFRDEFKPYDVHLYRIR
ncbi:MAG: hypothetical protein WBF17_23840, partial [Phycisphaerae bacterium]